MIKKHFNESAYSGYEAVFHWAKDHIEDRIYDLEDQNIYLDDLALELCDRENADGGVFYNDKKALDFIFEHRYDAAEALRRLVEETGSCKPNPLSNPDAFCVYWLIDVCRDILAESDTVNEGGKVKLTSEMIEKILEEINDDD